MARLLRIDMNGIAFDMHLEPQVYEGFYGFKVFDNIPLKVLTTDKKWLGRHNITLIPSKIIIIADINHPSYQNRIFFDCKPINQQDIDRFRGSSDEFPWHAHADFTGVDVDDSGKICGEIQSIQQKSKKVATFTVFPSSNMSNISAGTY